MVHHFHEQQGVDHGYRYGAAEEEQSLGVAAELVAAYEHDADTGEREDDAYDELRAYALAVGEPHAEGDEEGYGGYDHGGEAAADELHTAGLAQVVDEGLAESQQEEPFDVLAAYRLQAPCEQQRGQHHGGGYGEAEGYEGGDGHVLFCEEQLFGKYEADAPENDRQGDDDIRYCSLHGVRMGS